MSDETEDVKRKVALAMAAVTDADIEIEASVGRVLAIIKHQIIANHFLSNALASCSLVWRC